MSHSHGEWCLPYLNSQSIRIEVANYPSFWHKFAFGTLNMVPLHLSHLIQFWVLQSSRGMYIGMQLDLDANLLTAILQNSESIYSYMYQTFMVWPRGNPLFGAMDHSPWQWCTSICTHGLTMGYTFIDRLPLVLSEAHSVLFHKHYPTC